MHKQNKYRSLYPIVGFLLVVSLACQAQYENGYIVQLNGDTVRGLVLHRNWDSTPQSISFKKSQASDPQRLVCSDLGGFRVGNEIYQRAITQIDEANYKEAASLSPSPVTEYVWDTVFLETLFDDELKLLYLKDRLGKVHFFLKHPDQRIEPLIYKRYNVVRKNPKVLDTYQKVVAENQEYKKQLFAHFRAKPALLENQGDDIHQSGFFGSVFALLRS